MFSYFYEFNPRDVLHFIYFLFSKTVNLSAGDYVKIINYYLNKMSTDCLLLRN